MPDPTTIAKSEPAQPAKTGRDSEDRDLDSLVGDTKTLTEDVTEWLRLKIQLIQIEVHERVTQEVNALLSSILVLGLLLVAIFLAMFGVGLFIGQWLENEALGFGIVSLLVVLVAILLGRTQPQWIGDVMYFLVPRRWIKAVLQRDDEPGED
jgi:hypothetical protein